MHKIKRHTNRIVAMLMCILLLSNVNLNVALAIQESIKEVAYVTFHGKSDDSFEVKTKNEKMIAYYEGRDSIYITPKETAIYNINVESGGQDVKYKLYVSNSYNSIKYAALATTYYNSETPLTANSNKNLTEIDVVLKAGQKYRIEILDGQDDISVTVVKRNINELAIMATNIPSCIVSAKMSEITNPTNSVERFDDTNIKMIDYIEKDIEKYGLIGKETGENVQKGGWLEGLLVDIVCILVSCFISIIEWVLGTSDKLTIDNIIFNRYDETVIDLTPLGGIQHTSLTAGKGLFNNPKITAVVSALYNNLKLLTIAIYIVMLLYIGVKILLSVGSKDEKKYIKYLEYWLTGVLFLVIIPYMLPLIPTVTNSLVTMMEQQAKTINGKYTVNDVLEALGREEGLLGEDAEIVTIHKLLDERIDELQSFLIGQAKTREEAQLGIDNLINETLEKTMYTSTSKEKIKEKIDKVIKFIDDNYDIDWTEEIEEEYNQLIKEVKDTIYIMDTLIENMKIPESISKSQAWDRGAQNLFRAIRNSAQNGAKEDDVDKVIKELDKIITSINKTDGNVTDEQYNMAIKEIDRITQELMKGEVELIKNLEIVFENYINSVVQEKIDQLKEMRREIKENKDVMTELKSKAQEQHRLVYAAAWVILVVQMFSILFMYYKRVFVIVILVVIFPIIMTFYVIDKVQDGKAQSLSTWFKEFLANMFVQVLHAGIYIILINIGIEACDTDPTKYWFFLILTVCFLFPGERILRNILDLKSSTLGTLSNKGAIGLAATAAIAAKRKISGKKKDSGDNGSGEDGEKKKKLNPIEKMKKEIEEDEKKRQKNKKKKEATKKRKEAARKQRQEKIKDGKAGNLAKLHEKYDTAKDNVKKKINGFAPVKKTKEVINKVKNSKMVKAMKTTSKYGRYTLKKGRNLIKKGASLGFGAVEAMESFGEEGFASGIATAVALKGSLGSKLKNKENQSNIQQDNNKNQENKAKAARYKSVYRNGQKVNGRNSANPTTNTTANSNTVPTSRTTTTNNASRPVDYYSSRSTTRAIRTKLNINKTKKDNEIKNS